MDQRWCWILVCWMKYWKIANRYIIRQLLFLSTNQDGKTCRINIEGTANIVNACLNNQVEKLVHVSSVAALGRPYERVKRWMKTPSGPKNQQLTLRKNKIFIGAGSMAGYEWRIECCDCNPSIIIGEAPWETGSMAIFKKHGKNFMTIPPVPPVMWMRKMWQQPWLHWWTVTLQQNVSFLCNEHRSLKTRWHWLQTISIKTSQKPAKWMMDLIWYRSSEIKKSPAKNPCLPKQTVKHPSRQPYMIIQKIRKALPVLRLLH